MTANNWNFIVAAYVLAWAAVVGYWVFVHRAVTRARARYEQAVSAAERTNGSGS